MCRVFHKNKSSDDNSNNKLMLDSISSPSLTLASNSSSPTNHIFPNFMAYNNNNQLSSSTTIPTTTFPNHHHSNSLVNFLQFPHETNTASTSTVTHQNQISPRGGGDDGDYGGFFGWDMGLEENGNFQNGFDAMRSSFEVDNSSMVLL